MIRVEDGQVTEAKEGELLIVERSARTPASPSRLKPGVYYRFKGATRSIFQFIQQSGATAWGNISGSLNDQTDLAAALNGKIDSVQAGANVSVDNSDPKNPIVSASSSGDIDGGNASTIYLSSQVIDGGGA